MASKTLKYSLTNAAIIFVGLVFYTFLLNFIVIHADLTWLQAGEAWSVYAIQSSLGVNATYNSTEVSIAYAAPPFSMQVIALCTGISELLFFAFLVLLFRGPSRGTKLKGLAVFLPAIFIINMVRLLAIHPLAMWLGVQAMWDVHWFVWKYGMFMVLMALFTLWYWFFAKGELQKSMRG